MKKQDLIAVEDFCQYHSIEVSFIRSLNESGLIQTTRSGHKTFLSFEELPRVEKFVRLHYDLDINIHGLEAIDHLLDRVEALQQELLQWKNRVQDI
ncbi:MAG: chaperone modulator CbpM [Chitinophagaceae bacterium]|nr:chaperone modulator CbpM [Chitinophagaceae bacterium]